MDGWTHRLAVVLDPSVFAEEGRRQAQRQPQFEGETVDSGRKQNGSLSCGPTQNQKETKSESSTLSIQILAPISHTYTKKKVTGRQSQMNAVLQLFRHIQWMISFTGELLTTRGCQGLCGLDFTCQPAPLMPLS